jgi:ABC-type dipeptide/oligopeptide/nickel transport system permease subunit
MLGSVQPEPKSIPALLAPSPTRRNPLLRSPLGIAGMLFLIGMFLACLGTLPWTLADVNGSPRYNAQDRLAQLMPPSWVFRPELDITLNPEDLPDGPLRRTQEVALRDLAQTGEPQTSESLNAARPFYVLGTDVLGRSLFVRVLTGGGISLTIGLAAAFLSVLVGTLYGAIAGYAGGRVDAIMMRIVDVLFGLPYILLVVLLAVAIDAAVGRWQTSNEVQTRAERDAYVQQQLVTLPEAERDQPALAEGFRREALARIPSRELSPAARQSIAVITLVVAIGGVSWLTMARVIRGQVLSLKAQPFIEAARAAGASTRGIFVRHLLPNLIGPIVVYATLTVPQAILQESFLSFLGIGVRPPLPSWGNLAAEGLSELNPYRSHWWLLLFPCLLLGTTLLALNFVGEALREALDPKRSRRR